MACPADKPDISGVEVRLHRVAFSAKVVDERLQTHNAVSIKQLKNLALIPNATISFPDCFWLVGEIPTPSLGIKPILVVMSKALQITPSGATFVDEGKHIKKPIPVLCAVSVELFLS